LSFVDDHLMEGETVQHRTRLHWIFFLAPIVLFIIALALFNGPDEIKPISAILVIFSLLWLLFRIIDYITSEFAVTNKRVLFKTGFIRRSSLEILLTKIEMISVNQSILGRILRYGTIVVGGTGGSKNKFGDIADPLKLRLNVQQQIDIIQAGSDARHSPGP